MLKFGHLVDDITKILHMDIWDTEVQRFAKPEAQMVLFVITDASYTDTAPAEEPGKAQLDRIARGFSMSKVMGSWHYVMAILDTTTMKPGEVSFVVRVSEYGDSYPQFKLWLETEFPSYKHEPMTHGKKNVLDCTITLTDADAIRFRFMFPYVK